MRFSRGQTPIPMPMPMPMPGLDPDQTAAPPPDTTAGRDEPEGHSAVGTDDGEPHPQSSNRPRQGQTETPIGDGVPADDRPSTLSITAAEDERQGHGETDLEQSPVSPLPIHGGPVPGSAGPRHLPGTGGGFRRESRRVAWFCGKGVPCR